MSGNIFSPQNFSFASLWKNVWKQKKSPSATAYFNCVYFINIVKSYLNIGF